MGYSLDSISASCYPGTSVLINKFDIQDENKLNEVEGTISSIRHAEWLNNPLVQSFDFAHYEAIHKHLFSDIYDWAGEVRTVNISKKGTYFTNSTDIEAQAEQIFLRLAACNFFRTHLPLIQITTRPSSDGRFLIFWRSQSAATFNGYDSSLG